MCGIAGFHIKNPEVVKQHGGIELLVDKLLLGIESRGKHATGFVAVTRDGHVRLDKAAKSATEFIKDRERIPEGVQTVLLHTRWATKGVAEVEGNNHPVISGTCFTVHNGMINNDDDLFREFKFQRNYEVDTEIIPAMFYKSGLKDPKKVKEALEKFRGAMAIATIDPVKAPKRLLLAKGDNSPLVVYESDNFIMWASLVTVMREAWKEVLGTPPNFDKFEHLKDGDFILVDDAKSSRATFKVPRPFYSVTGHGQRRGVYTPPWKSAQEQRERQTPTTTTPSGLRIGNDSWDKNKSPFDTAAEHRAAVAVWRKENTTAARLWSKRDEYTDDWFDDIPDGENVSWIPCKCGESVCAPDMRHHIKYGYVCVDCYATIRAEYMRKINQGNSQGPESKPTSTGPGRGSEDDFKIHKIPAKDKQNMENWAAVEAESHKLILMAVSSISGYSRDAIDFIVFRTGAEIADFGVGTRTLKQDLAELYEKMTPVVWEDFSTELLSNTLASDIVGHGDVPDRMQYVPFQVKKDGAISESWFTCVQHGESFRLGDECASCSHQDDIASQVTGGRVKPQQLSCDECGGNFPRWQVVYKSPENYYLCEECNQNFVDPDNACGVTPFAQESNELDEQIGGEKPNGPTEEKKKTREIERCPECKSFISKIGPCKVCFVNGPADKEREHSHCQPGVESEDCGGCYLCGRRVPTQELTQVDVKKLTHCSSYHAKGECRKAVRWCVGEAWGYCDKHFGICNKARCKNIANHILADGLRVCHNHSRNQEGAQADTALLRAGYIVTEVKK